MAGDRYCLLAKSIDDDQNRIVSVTVPREFFEVHTDVLPRVFWNRQWIEESLLLRLTDFCSLTIRAIPNIGDAVSFYPPPIVLET